MKKNWNKEKDKFNKKLNSIFFVIYLKKKRYIYMKKNGNKEKDNLIRNWIIYFLWFILERKLK
jgi:hypothetical protein